LESVHIGLSPSLKSVVDFFVVTVKDVNHGFRFNQFWRSAIALPDLSGVTPVALCLPGNRACGGGKAHYVAPPLLSVRCASQL
jgi:hypothetical protein